MKSGNANRVNGWSSLPLVPLTGRVRKGWWGGGKCVCVPGYRVAFCDIDKREGAIECLTERITRPNLDAISVLILICIGSLVQLGRTDPA